jgi:hypothetical protein
LGGLKAGVPPGRIGPSSGRLNLLCQHIPASDGFPDLLHEALRVKIHVGKGGKQGLADKTIQLAILEADAAPLHRDPGKALESVDLKVLQGSHIRLFAANAQLGAPFSLGGLFALKTKHRHSPFARFENVIRVPVFSRIIPE